MYMPFKTYILGVVWCAVAVAQYSVGWSVFHGAHTAVLGIGVFGTSSSHHPYAQPQRHQGTCATDRWGHLSTTVLEDFKCIFPHASLGVAACMHWGGWLKSVG